MYSMFELNGSSMLTAMMFLYMLTINSLVLLSHLKGTTSSLRVWSRIGFSRCFLEAHSCSCSSVAWCILQTPQLWANANAAVACHAKFPSQNTLCCRTRTFFTYFLSCFFHQSQPTKKQSSHMVWNDGFVKKAQEENAPRLQTHQLIELKCLSS